MSDYIIEIIHISFGAGVFAGVMVLFISLAIVSVLNIFKNLL